MLTQPKSRYLEKTNFATNYAFLPRHWRAGRHRAAHSSGDCELLGGVWRRSRSACGCRLFDGDGAVILAEWDEPTPADRRRHRHRQCRRGPRPLWPPRLYRPTFSSTPSAPPGMTSSNTRSTPMAPATSPACPCTHDANAWPSDRYAGMPAPHDPASASSSGSKTAMPRRSRPAPSTLDRMGAEQPRLASPREVPGYATSRPSTWPTLLPNIAWPAQIEAAHRASSWCGRATRWSAARPHPDRASQRRAC